MAEQKRPISRTGFQNLQDEWQLLYRETRPKLLEEIAFAAAQGDRSENAEYIYGRKKLREIDKRMRELDHKIQSSKVIEQVAENSPIILFGAMVQLRNVQGQTMEVQLVGPDEIDPTAGKISPDSPMGKALMGHSNQGEIRLIAPRGEKIWMIEGVSYP